MTDAIKIQLDPVQETLLIPLWARAQEMAHPQPILRDVYAQSFLQAIIYDFTTIEKRFGLTRLLWPVRAATFDTVLCGFIAVHPGACIVNLGAGLDTTFFRVDDGTIRWFDVDLPEIIALRRQFIPESDRLHFIAGSAWGDWPGQIPGSEAPVMIVAAGLLFYYTAAEVQTLLTRIADVFPQGELLLDFVAPIFCGPEKQYHWGIWDASTLPVLERRLHLVQQWRYYNQYPARWSLPFRLLRPLVLKFNGMAHLTVGAGNGVRR